MITKSQRQYLKGLANNVKPLVKIGKMGLTENILNSIDEVLTAHEIVKVDVLPVCEETASELSIQIASETHSELVCQLGRKIVLYRRNPDKVSIVLPR